ncbi:MAG TPA: UPF0280 family protein [Bryobacteraceae bacterium]|nr:UPF0280 family protein [Bryobacteraceae bacterium]
MNRRLQMRMLPDGRRLHLHDGPIDLIVEAFGAPQAVTAAYRAAFARFETVLDELCSELSFLRQPCVPESKWPCGRVARRMMAATLPYATEFFITPMAAVAGSVAEEVLASMIAATDLDRAYVNDGGDIALHLNPGERFTIGMVERPGGLSLFGASRLRFDDPVRGIATSGWRGRSFSLGIADAVTVVADRAAAADAAATIIANAVDLPEHPAIVRVPACELAPDSDLGRRRVTQAVGDLSCTEIDEALSAGVLAAERLRRVGLIRAAALHLAGVTRVVEAIDRLKLFEAERSLVHA